MIDLSKAGIVETEWLAAELNAPDLLLIDASWHMPGSARNARKEFEKARIPGAIFFDIDDIADTSTDLPHMLPSPVAFSSAMRKLGIGSGARLVVYDSHGIMSAPRVWWTFQTMGMHSCAVLNGGFKKWIAEGRDVDNSPYQRRVRSHFTARKVPELVTDAEGVLHNLDNDGVQIFDARPAARFTGQDPEPREGLRRGHMPGACSLPFNDLINADGTLKSREELEKLFGAAGLQPGKRAITTCGSGITACVLALGLFVIGHKNFSVYDGSWAEWGLREREGKTLPVAND